MSVSRLAGQFKAGPLFDAISAIRDLGQILPVKLLIVGGGPARHVLEGLASQVNALLGRAAILFVGPMLDPRQAYAAADIVIGMGGSALRGLAFSKPVVVVGQDRYSKLFSPQSANLFYDTGMYGRAVSLEVNCGLKDELFKIMVDKELRRSLGNFGRDYVIKNHSLLNITKTLHGILSRSKVIENHDPSEIVRDTHQN